MQVQPGRSCVGGNRRRVRRCVALVGVSKQEAATARWVGDAQFHRSKIRVVCHPVRVPRGWKKVVVRKECVVGWVGREPLCPQRAKVPALARRCFCRVCLARTTTLTRRGRTNFNQRIAVVGLTRARLRHSPERTPLACKPRILDPARLRVVVRRVVERVTDEQDVRCASGYAFGDEVARETVCQVVMLLST